jgi:hypothetical protein
LFQYNCLAAEAGDDVIKDEKTFRRNVVLESLSENLMVLG